MSSPSFTRLPRWPFPVVLLLVVAGLWLLDGRQPEPWPEAATPWFEQVRGLGGASRAIDLINARVPLTPDLPLASVLLVLVVCGTTLATLLTLQVPAALAVGVGAGLAATRSVWSTAVPGADALDIAIIAIVVLGLARHWRSTAAAITAAAATVGLAPWAAWSAVPAVAALAPARRGRVLGAIVLVVVATAVQGAWVRHLWSGIACLTPGNWLPALLDVLRPSAAADASAWLAVRQAFSLFAGDVHVFGLAVAALGLWHAPGEWRRVRTATLIVAAIALVALAVGFVSPGRSVALLLPWWAPWFGRGLTALCDGTRGRARALALAFCLTLALVTPVLRHVTVVPEPWVGGTPAIARAVASTWRGEPVASDASRSTRRLRLAGATPVPLDAQTLAPCVANGAPVHAVGTIIPAVERLGYRVTERALHAPLAAVLRDLRPDQLVALALPPAAIAWVGPEGLAGLSRLSLARDQLNGTPAVAVVARTDRGGSVGASRDGVDLTVPVGAMVGGRMLQATLSASAHDDDATVVNGAHRVAVSRHAALAVFDRAQDVSLRAVGRRAPGLPVSLLREARWRHGVVDGDAACVPASGGWTPLASPAGRISLPAAGSVRRPAVVYVAMASPGTIDVNGGSTAATVPAWTVETLDTQQDADAIRLAAVLDLDDVPAALRPRDRWITRVAIGPAGRWHGGRAVVTAGSGVSAWLVRLAAGGRRSETSAVCAMPGGGALLLRGQYGALDDESVREIAIRQGEGWHPAEPAHGDTFQWTAQPTATATFHVARPTPLHLVLDVVGAQTAAGPQPVTIRINGHVLRPDWHGAGRIDIPAALVRRGDNLLSLDVATVVQPPGDARSLGVQVSQFRVIDPQR